MTARLSHAALVDLATPIRRRWVTGVAAAAVGAVGAMFGIPAWGARLGWSVGPAWILAAWSLALLTLAGAAWAVARHLRRTRPARLARRMEKGLAWRRGSLSALLEPIGAGGSAALLVEADAAAATTLRARGEAGLGDLARRGRRLRTWGLATSVVGLALLGSARPLEGGARALWRPLHAVHTLLAPIRIEASASSVEEGGGVTLTVTAAGRRQALLWLRTTGEGWRSRRVALDADGTGSVETGPLAADLFVHATGGGRSSDTLAIRVRLPTFIEAMAVAAHYPAYLHRDPEPLPLDGDTVVLPLGTRLITSGEATGSLSHGEWRGPDGTIIPLAIRGDRFAGDFVPRRGGHYTLALRAASGAEVGGAGAGLVLTLAPDTPPTVEIPVPGGDTTIGVGPSLPLVLEARDDHGLSRIELETTLPGVAPALIDLPLPAGEPDHLVLPWTLDLPADRLGPGDSVRVRAWATDNAPAPHRLASRSYLIRLVTLAQAREAAATAARAVQAGLDSAFNAGRAVARKTEDLALERPRPDSAGGSDRPPALSYEEAQRGSAVARAQRELQQQAAAARDAIAELRRQAAAAHLDDPALQGELDRIGQELDRALTPQLRQDLARLEEAIRDLDAAATQSALRVLAADQQGLQQAVARSRELFRRAAAELQLADLHAAATDLATRQQGWNEALRTSDPARAAKEESGLAARGDSLAAGLDSLAPRLAADGADSALATSAQRAREAADAMREASEQAGRGDRDQAARSGGRAEERLKPLAEALRQRRQELQSKWRSEVTDALDLALTETARLSARQLALSAAFGRGDPVTLLRDEEAGVQEGVERVVARLRDAAGKNALVSPDLAVTMTQALVEVERARNAIADAAPDRTGGATHAGAAVDALNAAAYLLLRNRDEVAGSGSGSGMAEAMGKLRELAGQQGSLGAAATALLPGLGSAGSLPQVQALGGKERAIADALERLRGEGKLPGAGSLAQEARALAERLESGKLDRPTVERQQRLFRRMLDAGRTLQGNDVDPDQPRVSRTAEGDSVHLPPALVGTPARPAVQMPGWDDLRRYTPEERRLVTEYFRRLLVGGR